MFICRQEGALFYWYQIDTNGLYNSGSAAEPSISFAQDTDTGIFKKTTDTLAIAAGGNEVASWSNMLVTSAIPHLFTTGTSAAPAISFISDPDTGFYKLTDKIVFTADAVDKFAFTKIGTIETAGDLSFTLMDGLTPIKLRAGSMMVSNAADDALIPVNGIYSKGNVRTGGQFLGTATSALYADLAERYESDMILEPGTICEIGGEKEITIAVNGNRVFGIISTNPGFKLNAEAGNDVTHPFVALAGKVPCRLIGKIKKGDEVQLSAIPGVGELRKYSNSYSHCIGRALENKDTDEEGLVMVVTRAVI